MNFKESLKKLRNMSDDEVVTMVEKATGKELVSYEGIDALVAALMGFYNGELKKKSSTGHKHTKEEITDFTHNHDDRYNTKNEINDKLNTKLDKGGLPTKITNAKSLYDLIENNSGLNFDPNLLFLNDAGTKTQGKIYFDKNKKGMFKCIKQTTGVVNSTEFFVDISNNASSDKLENLFNSMFRFCEKLYSTHNLDNVKQTGFYIYYIESGLPENMPKDSKVRGVIFVLNCAQVHILQVVFDYFGALSFRIHIEEWSPWRQIKLV